MQVSSVIRGSFVASMPIPSAPQGAASLQRNVAWALVGNLGYSACQWGVLACIAKLGTATDVGLFALGLALTAPIITLTSLNLRLLQATDAREDYPFSVYFSVRLLGTVLGLAAITALALGLGFRGATLSLILAVALAKAFEAVSEVVFGLLQRAENLRRMALSMLAKGAVSVLAVGIVLKLTGSIVLATLAMALCWGSLLAAYDLPAAVRLTSIRPSLALRSLASLTWVALPLGCVAGLGSLTFNVPRYAIEASIDPPSLGHFTALAYLFVAGSQPLLALGAAVSPRLARHFVTDQKVFRRLTLHTILIAGGLGLLAVAVSALCGRALLTVAYAPEYADYAPILVWLAVATGIAFLATALSYAVTAARRLPEQLPIALLSLAVCSLTSWFLVPRYGLLGAAWAVLATETTRLACLGVVYAAAIAAPRGTPATRSEAAAAVPAAAVRPASPRRVTARERSEKARPVLVEITGCSGSGKSTLLKEVLDHCAERGVRLATAPDILLRGIPDPIIASRLLRNLVLDLRGLRETVVARQYLEFLAFAKSVIRRDSDWRLTGLNAYRSVLRKLGVYAALSRRTSRQLVLVDEGTIHSAHNILVHVPRPPRPEDIDAFCRLVPMPDLVVHVTAPLEVVLARTFARRDPPLRGRTREETERFIRHGYVLLDQLMTHESLAQRTVRVPCNGDGPGACRVSATQLVDFLIGRSANTPRIASRP